MLFGRRKVNYTSTSHSNDESIKSDNNQRNKMAKGIKKYTRNHDVTPYHQY